MSKFAVGFFGILLLFSIVTAFMVIVAWISVKVGPVVGIIVAILAVAIFGGFMNAAQEEKK